MLNVNILDKGATMEDAIITGFIFGALIGLFVGLISLVAYIIDTVKRKNK